MNISAITKMSVASLDYAAFTKAINNACRVIDKRSAAPVLEHVLIKAAPGGAQVTGTNIDLTSSNFVSGTVDPSFCCVVRAHRVQSILKKAKQSDTVNFTLQNGSVVMYIGKLHVTITPGAEVADFPDDTVATKELSETKCSFVMETATLLRVLAKVSPAISTEETRYYLNGIFMHVVPRRKKLTFVATDGHRLSRYEVPAPAGAGAMHEDGIIIPRLTIAELMRLLKRKDCPHDVMISVTRTRVSFLIGEDELLVSKVVDGTFPDYNRVIPTQNTLLVEIMPSLMTEAVEQASTVIQEDSRAVKLTWGNGYLTASCSDPDFGKAEMQVASTSELELEIGFNSRYLLSILSLIDGKAEFQFADAGSPALIRDLDNDGITHVLMPMRV